MPHIGLGLCVSRLFYMTTSSALKYGLVFQSSGQANTVVCLEELYPSYRKKVVELIDKDMVVALIG